MAISELEEFRSESLKNYARKKKIDVSVAMKIASFQTPSGIIGDNMFAFGDYNTEADPIVYTGNPNVCFRFKNGFVVTGCQRIITDKGTVALQLRDDREKVHKVKKLIDNGDMDFVSFVKFLEPVLECEFAEVEEFKNESLKNYARKKKIDVRIAMKVAAFEMPNGIIGNNMFAFGEYNTEADPVVFTGNPRDCFRFKSGFVVTGCQRVITDKGTVALQLRDDRDKVCKVKKLIDNGDMDFVAFAKFLEPVLKCSF